jgi:tetratricopeptide (TPR) repeat protein
MGRQEEAIAAARRAIELDPNFSAAYGTLAFALGFIGDSGGALEAVEKAFRGSPRDPFRWTWMQASANAHFAAKRYEEAFEAAKQTARLKQGWLGCHIVLAASAAYVGHDEEAKSAVRELLRLVPGYSLSRQTKAPLFIPPETIRALVEGLRRAGLPEE